MCGCVTSWPSMKHCSLSVLHSLLVVKWALSKTVGGLLCGCFSKSPSILCVLDHTSECVFISISYTDLLQCAWFFSTLSRTYVMMLLCMRMPIAYWRWLVYEIWLQRARVSLKNNLQGIKNVIYNYSSCIKSLQNFKVVLTTLKKFLYWPNVLLCKPNKRLCDSLYHKQC